MTQGYTTDHGLPPSVSDGLGAWEATPGSGTGPGLANHRASLGSGAGQPGQPGPPSEQQAIIAIEKAYAKPVAFSVRTNVMYDGTLDDDSPVHGCAVR